MIGCYRKVGPNLTHFSHWFTAWILNDIDSLRSTLSWLPYLLREIETKYKTPRPPNEDLPRGRTTAIAILGPGRDSSLAGDDHVGKPVIIKFRITLLNPTLNAGSDSLRGLHPSFRVFSPTY